MANTEFFAISSATIMDNRPLGAKPTIVHANLTTSPDIHRSFLSDLAVTAKLELNFRGNTELERPSGVLFSK
jgi:hypothetical protein